MMWLIIAMLGLMAVAFVLAPLVLAGRQRTLDRKQMNLALYQQRLEELQREDLPEDLMGQLKTELQKGLLRDVEPQQTEDQAVSLANAAWGKKLIFVTGLCVPLLAIVLYADWGLSLGASQDLAVSEELKTLHKDMSEFPKVLDRLRDQLEHQPENHDGWYMYGQYSLAGGRYREAAEAFQQLSRTFPENAGLASIYAETLYLAADRKFDDQVRQAISAALALNPHQPTMLELKGIDAWQSGRNQESLDWLRQALATNPQGSRAQTLKETISQLESTMGIEAPSAAAEQELALEVSVTLEAGLNLPPDGTVFVYARATQGPPMPLAITRFTVADLPRTVRLTESMAMMPQMSLASYDPVTVIARISSTGDVAAGPEDYEARSVPLSVRSQSAPVQLHIQEKVKNLVSLKEANGP